jgi:hypothetical protein
MTVKFVLKRLMMKLVMLYIILLSNDFLIFGFSNLCLLFLSKFFLDLAYFFVVIIY